MKFPFVLWFVLCWPLIVVAQAQKPATASITGRITFKEKPLPGVLVTLENARPNSGMPENPPSARTDTEGRYHLTGIAAGNYVVSPRALAYAVPMDGGSYRPGKSVNLGEGETLENFDFALVKGGVIAGTITDHNGRAVIGQNVRLTRITENQQTRDFRAGTYRMYNTDDRGAYRLFGLPAGRYKIGLGEGDGTLVMGRAGGFYRLTYYPGVANEAEAKVIELEEGGEVTDIDFKVRAPEKTYDAKGRIIDGVSGEPLAGMTIARAALAKDQQNIGGYGWTSDRTEANGEFVLRGLSPGRYAAFSVSEGATDYYSDPTMFEVTNSDVEGLEVKAYRGAVITGVAVIEGANDPAVQKLLPHVTVNASVFSGTMQMPSRTAQIKPDGTFRLSGLRSGKTQLSTYAAENTPLQLVRIERDGVLLRDGVELAAAEQMSGVKVVLAYGAGVIRGQVKVVGGTLSSDTRLMVWANHSGAAASRSAQVDVRGSFVLDSLAPGEYKLSVSQSVVSGTSMVHRAPVVLQTVTVGSGETAVTLTLDLNTKKEGQQ